jgi:hypothetical protein
MIRTTKFDAGAVHLPTPHAYVYITHSESISVKLVFVI